MRTSLIRAALALLGVALTVAPAPAQETLVGVIRVGPAAYEVLVVTSHRAVDEVDLRVAITAVGEPVRLARLMLRPTSGSLIIGKRSTAVPPAVATSWWRQLSSVSSASRQGIISVAKGLPGRLALNAEQGKLRELRFFSLEEWNNSFGQYVSLGLSPERSGREP